MKCPHCLVAYHSHAKALVIGTDIYGKRAWMLLHEVCPACGKIVLAIKAGDPVLNSRRELVGVETPPKYEFLAYPRIASRSPCPAEVPPSFADDYREACLVLTDSPKASAALTRRCLQNLLRDVAKVKPGNLADEIQQVIDSGKLPSYLVESIDAIRNIGNFAAHPMKGQKSGEMLPVEPGEAEWNLAVLESLFDFYFVQPKVVRTKREALDRKLKDAGKPKMK